jgi:hypothetical protein
MRAVGGSKVLAIAVISMMIVGGCSTKKETASTTSTPSIAGTSSTSASTSASTSSTSTTKPAPAPPAVPITIPASTDGTSPDGSGCAPPPGPVLPDGIWFGTLKAVDPGAGTIGLDLACWFTGDAANAAATADGQTDVPVPNDYYIRNKVKLVYTLRAAPTVQVLVLAKGPDGTIGSSLGPPSTGIAAATDLLGDSQIPGLVWVQVTDGWVVVVQQQYVP